MKKGLLSMIFLGFVLVLAACGGTGDSDPVGNTDANNASEQTEDSGTSDTASSNNIEVISTNWDFDQDEYIVKAGEEVKLTHTNAEGMHGIVIEGLDVQIDGDGETTFTPDTPGEYTIYCSIPCGQGHSDMVSTLIVK